jgi:iron complex outermembrane receptor protein
MTWGTAARALTRGVCVFAAMLLLPSLAHAQELRGRVTGAGGAPIEGAHVTVRGTNLSATTSADGSFRIGGAPAGELEMIVERIGYRRATVRGAADQATASTIVLEPEAFALDEVVVSASREAVRRAETAATINVVSKDEIARVRPTHPSELLNRVPGVYVNVTGGEGHMAAIRQPKTTNPVYLYMENGVPTRATGFFNHNALYEINLPQADRVEVVKGPMTALYGSDAIGGMINVMSRAPGDVAPLEVSIEGGSFGFARVLAAASHATARGGVMAELNATRTDGWRDGTAYDRESGTLRWDHRFSPLSSARSMVTFSRIDQSTAGSSALSEADYESHPELNYTPISYRNVRAARASVAFEHISGNTLFTITPFARWNQMEMLPNWSLTYDPAISLTGHASAGALVKVRRDFEPLRARIVAGFDLDYSPGTHQEWRVAAQRDGAIFADFTRGEVVYDYDVTFWSGAPYAQLELSPIERVRVTAALRYDVLGYVYDNPLGELQTGSHRRPASTDVQYEHLSPKLGVAVAPHDNVSFFAAYGHGFRAPSEGQLFRQGRAVNSLALEPVKADNYEVGGHARFGPARIEVAAYHMRKQDDLLSFTHTDGSTETVNAGTTTHRGVEVGAGVMLPAGLRIDAAFSVARHEYDEWTTRAGIDYSGNAMEDAPVRTGNLGLTWLPAAHEGAFAALEAQHVGRYWMDPANTREYDGHTLVNARAELPVGNRFALFARVANLFDERYAENATFTTARGAEYAPGMPRTFHAGVRTR